MKKYLLLTGLMLLSSLMIFATPFFPKTNVMELTIGEETNLEDINAGNLRLEESYPEDELIILNYYPSSSEYGNEDSQDMIDNLGASDGVSCFLNGSKKLNTFHKTMNFGQPVYGEMQAKRFASSPLYIDFLNFNTNTNEISFMIRDADDGLVFTDLTLSYLIVEKQATSNNRNIVRYIHNETLSISTDGGLTEKNFTPTGQYTDDYKVVIIIRDQDLNVIQSTSTIASKPIFRIVMQEDLSILGTSTESFDYGYFAIVNPFYDTDSIWNINIQLINDNIPTNWSTSFCDHENCYAFGYTDFQICGGDYHEFHATIYPNGPGYGQFSFRIEAEEQIDFINHYYSTNDADLLVIQDNMNEDNDEIIIESLGGTGLSYGIFKPGFSSYDFNDFQSESTLIWNAETIYSNLPYSALESFQNNIQNGSNLIVMGQYLTNILDNNNTSMYANQITQDFLSNVLNAELIESGNLSTNIIGEEGTFFQAHNFDLINDNSINANYSSNSISGTNPIFRDNNSNIKGIVSDYGIGQTFLYDFNISSINETTYRKGLINKTLMYLGVQVSNGDEVITKPLNDLKIDLYPNPVTNYLNVNIDDNQKQITELPEISIYNIKGQRIYKSIMDKNDSGIQKQIDLKNISMSSGIYFVRVKTNNDISTHKILMLKD